MRALEKLLIEDLNRMVKVLDAPQLGANLSKWINNNQSNDWSYPPCNVTKVAEDRIIIEMAVAGIPKDEIIIEEVYENQGKTIYIQYQKKKDVTKGNTDEVLKLNANGKATELKDNKDEDLAINSADAEFDKGVFTPVIIHSGLSKRSFKQKFHFIGLYHEVEIAKVEDGLLTIEVVNKIPPEKKPKLISIQ